jgi:Mg2+/Co2+ transporter CorB
LIFAEVAPKTFAAVAPERLSLSVARPLSFLLWLFYPLVFLANSVANGLLSLFGVEKPTAPTAHLSVEELRTVLFEAGSHIPSQHQEMLLSILDLEKMKIKDVMIPRHEIKHIDLEDEMDDIILQLTTATHTQLPLCEGGIDNVRGILHIRGVVNLLTQNKLTRKNLIHAARPAYFVPETTPLPVQLLHFRENKRRIALSVDEYGDIQGLVSVEDILEEIVGDLNFQNSFNPHHVQACDDGSYVVDGSLGVRELNRLLQWTLPIDGPKTLSGLIVERLESIPNPGTCLKIDGYYAEVLEIKGNLVRLASIKPAQVALHEDESNE